jgi:hypothetical protein
VRVALEPWLANQQNPGAQLATRILWACSGVRGTTVVTVTQGLQEASRTRKENLSSLIFLLLYIGQMHTR